MFIQILKDHDFLSLVMYDFLSPRTKFVHDIWVLAKNTECKDLKIALMNDPSFTVKRGDILTLLQTKDNDSINYML